jgi:hypothetical protein
MCMQCAAGAMVTMSAATGVRAWIAARSPAWWTPARARVATGALVAGGIVTAGLVA